MKKNKSIAYIIAAGLLVGGTFAGTKAWFGDSDSVDNSLIVTMGSFDLKVTENTKDVTGTERGGWTLVRGGDAESNIVSASYIKDGHVDTKFTNIRPGDYFTRQYTIENKGTLDQKLTITNQNITNKDGNGYTLTINETKSDEKGAEFKSGMILKAGEKRTFDLVLKTEESELTGVRTTENELIKIENPITITAEQIKAPTYPATAQ